MKSNREAGYCVSTKDTVMLVFGVGSRRQAELAEPSGDGFDIRNGGSPQTIARLAMNVGFSGLKSALLVLCAAGIQRLGCSVRLHLYSAYRDQGFQQGGLQKFGYTAVLLPRQYARVALEPGPRTT